MENNYVESLIFHYILENPNILDQYKARYFSNPLIQQVFDIAKEYIAQYKEQPTAEQVWELVKVSGKNENGAITYEQIASLWAAKTKLASYGVEWLDKTSVSYGEWKNLEDAIVRTVEYIKTKQVDVTYENAAEIVSNAKMIFQSKSNFNVLSNEAHDFFDPNTHKLDALETRTTGYDFLNKCLNGGWQNKTLNVFMAGPKTGKSMWLCNMCANAIKNGQDSVYITCEMAYQKIAQRIGSNILNIPIDDYPRISEDKALMESKFKEFYSKQVFKKPGALCIFEYPTSTATASMIEAALLKEEERRSTDGKPFKFKNIFIDYLNIMADAKHPNTENLYLKIKSICEDVRAMAQRNNWCVVSLTQVNRDGQEASDLSMTNVSESTGLTATVDSLFGIIRDVLMRVANAYYLKGLALRDSQYMGSRKKYNFEVKHLRITEDTEEPILDETTPYSPSVGGIVPNAPNVPQQNGNKPKMKTFKRDNGGGNTNQQPLAPQPQTAQMPFVPQTAPTLGISDAQVSISGQSLFT